jgi:hypothetical protein
VEHWLILMFLIIWLCLSEGILVLPMRECYKKEPYQSVSYRMKYALWPISERCDFCSRRCGFSEPQQTTQIFISYKRVRFSEPFSTVTRFRELTPFVLTKFVPLTNVLIISISRLSNSGLVFFILAFSIFLAVEKLIQP